LLLGKKSEKTDNLYLTSLILSGRFLKSKRFPKKFGEKGNFNGSNYHKIRRNNRLVASQNLN